MLTTQVYVLALSAIVGIAMAALAEKPHQSMDAVAKRLIRSKSKKSGVKVQVSLTSDGALEREPSSKSMHPKSQDTITVEVPATSKASEGHHHHHLHDDHLHVHKHAHPSGALVEAPPPPVSGPLKECHANFCDPDKGNMTKDFCAKYQKGVKCYDECCSPDEGTSCFPGEAISNVQGKGNVPLAQLKIGDKVLVKSQDELAYEPVLAFLHVMSKHSAGPLRFVTVTHASGAFRASPAHIVFVASSGGGSSWSSKLVGKLQVGDDIFVADGPDATWDSKPSRVLAIQRSVAQSGMYAPLTPSGTIVVDGVIASNYASSSEQKHLPHTLAHAFLLPVRLYHRLGLSAKLEPMWKSFCGSTGATKHWLCHGWAVMAGSETEAEELHPYLRVMWHGLKLDFLLPSQ